jgi:acyl-CoA reductase-like NAD-dependent aldehyde dehydrogenase
VRSDVLDRAGNLVMQRAKELGELLSREEGKTLAEGTGEVMRAARICKYFAGEALRRHGQTLESTRPSIDVLRLSLRIPGHNIVEVRRIDAFTNGISGDLAANEMG